MSDYDDAVVVDRVNDSEESDAIDIAIDTALMGDRLDLKMIDGAEQLRWDDVATSIANFSAQCRFFNRFEGRHPTVLMGNQYIPIDILGIPAARGETADPADARMMWRITEECIEKMRSDGLNTRMTPIPEVKATFKRELKRFILKRIDALFGSDPPASPLEDDFRGLRVTVSAVTANRLVVISNSFMARVEQPFGHGLTSPVVGYLPNAGCFYFGLLDGTNDRAHWSGLMYEIPPNLNVTLQI